MYLGSFCVSFSVNSDYIIHPFYSINDLFLLIVRNVSYIKKMIALPNMHQTLPPVWNLALLLLFVLCIKPLNALLLILCKVGFIIPVYGWENWWLERVRGFLNIAQQVSRDARGLNTDLCDPVMDILPTMSSHLLITILPGPWRGANPQISGSHFRWSDFVSVGCELRNLHLKHTPPGLLWLPEIWEPLLY